MSTLLKKLLKLHLKLQVVDVDDLVQLEGSDRVLTNKVIEHVSDATVLFVARLLAVRLGEHRVLVPVSRNPLTTRKELLVVLRNTNALRQ